MHAQYPFMFDARALIDHFGGAPSVVVALERVGVPVKLKAVQKWRERNFIPSDALAGLLLAADNEGKPVDLAVHVRRRE